MHSTQSLKRLDTLFDDGHLIDHAGLLLTATLGQHSGRQALVDEHLDLGTASAVPTAATSS